jgi:hypothetical protein
LRQRKRNEADDRTKCNDVHKRNKANIFHA